MSTDDEREMARLEAELDRIDALLADPMTPTQQAQMTWIRAKHRALMLHRGYGFGETLPAGEFEGDVVVSTWSPLAQVYDQHRWLGWHPAVGRQLRELLGRIT